MRPLEDDAACECGHEPAVAKRPVGTREPGTLDADPAAEDRDNESQHGARDREQAERASQHSYFKERHEAPGNDFGRATASIVAYHAGRSLGQDAAAREAHRNEDRRALRRPTSDARRVAARSA